MPKMDTHGPNSLTMASEDYLESVYRITLDQNAFEMGIRSVDVAEQLGVSKASVNKAIAALKDHGMVEQTRYGRVMLTSEGREYGRDVWRRHRVLRRFLIEELGVEQEQADDEACLIEHDISSSTMEKWCNYLERQGIEIEE